MPSPTLATRKGRRGGSQNEYLGFRLANLSYALRIDRIGEILRLPPVTRVPRAPNTVMGVVAVRGRVLTVVDVRPTLALEQLEVTSRARIFVLPETTRDPVGLYVDEVTQVYRFSEDEIEPAAQALGSDAGDHTLGIGRDAGELIVLVDLEPLLAF